MTLPSDYPSGIGSFGKMFRVFTVVVVLLVVYDVRSDLNQVRETVEKTARQKRLLFYDEEGNLVKTFKNPNFYDLAHAEKLPFITPFFSFFRPTTFGGPTAYMIPVSNQVIQQLNNDPVYQNKLLTVPRKDLVVEPNAQCAGKRAQIPAKSCKNFLNCWDGWAFEQECPEGLLFSKDGYCDYPQNVDCSKRTNDSPATPPVPSQPVTAQCSKEFQSFRNDQQCNEFFVCVDSTPIKFKCPADLLYNEELGVCDYAYRVNCQDSVVTMAEPVKPAPSNPTPPCVSPSDAKNPAAPPSIATVVPGIAPVLVDPPIIPSPSSLSTNTVFNQQSWSSTHVAISRQDAIRQLRLGANA